MDEMLLICIILPLTPERMLLRLFFGRAVYYFICTSSGFCTKVLASLALRPIHQHLPNCYVDLLCSGTAVVPTLVFSWHDDRHGCICFKEQDFAPLTQAEADLAIVQLERTLNLH